MFAAYTLIFSDDSLIFFIFAFAFAQCEWTLSPSRFAACISVLLIDYVLDYLKWYSIAPEKVIPCQFKMKLVSFTHLSKQR